MSIDERIELCELMLKFYKSQKEKKPIRVERRVRENGRDWVEEDFPLWSEVYEWREKPPLFEGWINMYKDPNRNCVHISKEEADKHKGSSRVRCIKVREVEE